jgi:hypothetical protein
MTTRPDHHEPLDAEERDLAARLGRVGPFDGPSPALDAKILAAAHAAAATRVPSRRRHFAWLGVPPALVTGVGVAAAAVLALGLVWQMRPQYGDIAAHGEADAEEEVILIAPMGTASAPVANPPPLPASPAQPAPSERASTAARVQDSVPASASAAKAAAPAPAAAEPAASDEAGLLAAQGVAPAEEKQAADASASASDGFVAEPPGTAATARKSHATYTTSARATAERRERANRNAPVAAAAPAAPAPVAAESDAATLDRIEVTGSRIAWSDIPISDDAHLAIAEWLERIRARRDTGDVDNARASLRLFQRQHPRIRLPADLRPLLTDAKQ